MRILNGKIVSRKYIDALKELQLKKHIVIFMIGNNPASEVYISNKKRVCEEVGFTMDILRYKDTITTDEFIKELEKFNNIIQLDGYIIQLPLPLHMDTQKIIDNIDPQKDLDCFHPENLGKLLSNVNYTSPFMPATPLGIILLLKHYNIYTKGINTVIIGKSIIVGTPLAQMMSLENGMGATVTLCDKNTINLHEHVKKADILIVAAGRHNLIDSTFELKRGVIIIDVGIHKISDTTKQNGYHLEGDVDFEYASKHASYITPVPGGVGPMTVISLLLNLCGSENLKKIYNIVNK